VNAVTIDPGAFIIEPDQEPQAYVANLARITQGLLVGEDQGGVFLLDRDGSLKTHYTSRSTELKTQNGDDGAIGVSICLTELLKSHHRHVTVDVPFDRGIHSVSEEAKASAVIVNKAGAPTAQGVPIIEISTGGDVPRESCVFDASPGVDLGLAADFFTKRLQRASRLEIWEPYFLEKEGAPKNFYKRGIRDIVRWWARGTANCKVFREGVRVVSLWPPGVRDNLPRTPANRDFVLERAASVCQELADNLGCPVTLESSDSSSIHWHDRFIDLPYGSISLGAGFRLYQFNRGHKELRQSRYSWCWGKSPLSTSILTTTLLAASPTSRPE